MTIENKYLVSLLWRVLGKSRIGRFEWVRVQNKKRFAFLVKNVIIVGE